MGSKASGEQESEAISRVGVTATSRLTSRASTSSVSAPLLRSPAPPLLLLSAAIGYCLARGLIEPHRFVVREYDVPMPGLPPSAEGLRIAQLSDLHCSAITPASLLRRVVDACNNLRPDVVALTGDYVSRRNSYARFSGARQLARPVMRYAEAMTAEIARLQAPEGVFSVSGNHDHARDRGYAIEELLRQSGVTILHNAGTRVRGLALCGVDDLRAGHPDFGAAFGGVHEDEASVVLSHNPRLLSLCAHRPCLMLSGHTHGGQIAFPGFAGVRLRQFPSDMKRSAWKGGWCAAGRARGYVHRGVGSVFLPLRFRCPPEIAVFTLRKED